MTAAVDLPAPVFGALVAAAGVALLVVAWRDSRRVARNAEAKSDAGWADRRSVKQ